MLARSSLVQAKTTREGISVAPYYRIHLVPISFWRGAKQEKIQRMQLRSASQTATERQQLVLETSTLAAHMQAEHKRNRSRTLGNFKSNVCSVGTLGATHVRMKL